MDDYKVGALLGTGAFGEVRVAVERQGGRKVRLPLLMVHPNALVFYLPDSPPFGVLYHIF